MGILFVYCHFSAIYILSHSRHASGILCHLCFVCYQSEHFGMVVADAQEAY